MSNPELPPYRPSPEGPDQETARHHAHLRFISAIDEYLISQKNQHRIFKDDLFALAYLEAEYEQIKALTYKISDAVQYNQEVSLDTNAQDCLASNDDMQFHGQLEAAAIAGTASGTHIVLSKMKPYNATDDYYMRNQAADYENQFCFAGENGSDFMYLDTCINKMFIELEYPPKTQLPSSQKIVIQPIE